MINDEKTFGKEPSCDVVIDNKFISRKHALIKQIGKEEFQITDLGSKNGIWVNGFLKKGTCNVKADDEVELANVKINLAKIFKINVEEKTNNNYSSEFAALRDVDEKFIMLKKKYEKEYKTTNIFIRIIAIVAVYIMAYTILPNEPNMFAIKMSIIAVSGILFSNLSIGKEKLKEKLEDLELQRAQKFVCPKCKTTLRSSWKDYLLYSKNCSKCGAQFFNH